MKKLIFFILISFIFASCTRSGSSENSKIQIKTPDLKTSYPGKVGTLSEPSALSDINCYMVFVGGPEQDLQRNTCPTVGNATNGTPSRNINFGLLYGGYPPSSDISIDVPSGNDRVLHLVGLRVSAPEICRDFKTLGFPGKNESSKPFILGTADRLLLEPSKTIEIPIKMTFDSSNGIEKCTGPDVPQDSGGNDGGSSTPYLRFEGIGRWSYPANKDLATVGQCYPVKPSLFVNGASWVDPNLTAIDINVSAFNAGQFYSDANCSTSISSLQIPAGQSRSATSYYFKALTPASNVTLSGFTVTGSSANLQNPNQPVDINYPKLTFQGPDKLTLYMCAKYKIISEYYEGGALNAPAGGLSINLVDNANFYLRSTSGCSSGSIASIAPATNSVDVYLKLMSSTTVSLESQVTAANFISSAYSVQSSTKSDYADAIQVLAKDSTIVRGVCNPITIRLVNADGGAASAKSFMNLVFKAPQGAGSFYTLPDCSGAPIGSISISNPNYEINIGFKANSLPIASLVSGKIPMQFHFGSLRIQNSLFSGPSEILFNVVDQNDPWFLHALPPAFNGAEIVGTQEFNDGGTPNTFKYIPLLANYTELAYTGTAPNIECSATPGTGYSPCTASELDTSSPPPYKYKWSYLNAASNTPRYVRFNYTNSYGSGNREIKISADALYGTNFKVLQCDSIASVNAPIETLSGYSGVVCLPENSVHARSSTTALTLSSTRTSFIGHSSMTSEIRGGPYAANIFYSAATNIPTSSFYMANLKFRNINSSNPAIGFANPTVASTVIGTFNNIDIDDGGTASSTVIVNIANNDPDLTLRFRNMKIKTTGPNNTAVMITSSSNVSIEDSNIDTTGLHGIFVSTASGTGSNIKVLNTEIKTTLGIALELANNSATSGAGIEIYNSRFQMYGAGNAGVPVVKLTNKIITGIFDNNVIMSDPGAPNSRLLEINSSVSNDISLSIRNNTFLQSYYGSPVIGISGGGSIVSTISDFSGNSMTTTSITNNNAMGVFNIATSTSLNIYTNISIPVGGANIACSNNASYIFTPSYVNNGALGGGLGLGTIPVIMDNMSVTSKRCSGP